MKIPNIMAEPCLQILLSLVKRHDLSRGRECKVAVNKNGLVSRSEFPAGIRKNPGNSAK
ncbi:hypothetical protein WN51_03795 [Melipona quadrifasciata]|uniref:Uncharacterized protein n=1 Tax=Melipona quadrifasciata TaxID=166423 RepID=A0A0N0BE78_9HYME|nr:hypothetical protein WN51_03795 [Melipona quadrifasciata]